MADAAFTHPYLDLARMEMLRRVRLQPRGAAEGSFAGPHASRWRGTAVEFADYRNYVAGDDIRLVDWKVFARSDRYYIRLFESERNLLCSLVVDCSGSMAFSGVEMITDSKLVYACRLAAALGYLVVNEGDEVGLALTRDAVDTFLPTRGGWIHLAALVNRLGAATATGETDLGVCLREVYRRLTRRGVLVVLSDFLDPGPDFWRTIDTFRQSHFDVLLFQLVHPEELELPQVPLARFTACEGREQAFLAEPDLLRDRYRQAFARHLDLVRAGARTRGCDHALARTDDDPYRFLRQCFLARNAGG